MTLPAGSARASGVGLTLFLMLATTACTEPEQPEPSFDAGTRGGTDAGTPPEVPSVPMERVTLGAQAYLAWQRPGDTFRIVCQEPCPIDEQYIFARYAGFLAVKDELLSLTGSDVMPQLVPVDIHLAGDSVCGPFGALAGASFMNWVGGAPGPGSNVCTWELEQSRLPPPYIPRPMTVENALSRESQVLLVHEYSHIVLFLRHDFSYEWLVRALSYRVGGTAASLCDPMNEQFARTGWELCQRHGLDYAGLAASLGEAAALYAADGGTEELYAGVPSTVSSYQFRRILDRHAGGDTLPACIAGGELRANQCGDSARFTPEGGTVRMYEGRVQWELPAGALGAPVQVEPGTWRRSMLVPEQWSDFAWAHAYGFEPEATAFNLPARLTLRYDPALIPDGGSEASLTLYRLSPNQPVPGAQVDVEANTVSAPVTGLGRYVIAPR